MSRVGSIRDFFWPRSNPHPDLGLKGDMDDVEVLMAVERHFAVHFTEQEAEALRTVGEFFGKVVVKAAIADRPVAWREFAAILADHGAVPADKVDPKMQFFAHI